MRQVPSGEAARVDVISYRMPSIKIAPKGSRGGVQTLFGRRGHRWTVDAGRQGQRACGGFEVVQTAVSEVVTRLLVGQRLILGNGDQYSGASEGVFLVREH